MNLRAGWIIQQGVSKGGRGTYELYTFKVCLKVLEILQKKLEGEN